MTVWRRAIRWLVLALACASLGVSAVPSRALAQADVAAQVELAARKAQKFRQLRTIRSGALRSSPPRERPIATAAARRRPALHQRPAPPGRLYLTHRALLR